MLKSYQYCQRWDLIVPYCVWLVCSSYAPQKLLSRCIAQIFYANFWIAPSDLSFSVPSAIVMCIHSKVWELTHLMVVVAFHSAWNNLIYLKIADTKEWNQIGWCHTRTSCSSVESSQVSRRIRKPKRIISIKIETKKEKKPLVPVGNTGTKDRSFSPGWYYQPGLKVTFNPGRETGTKGGYL